ncbi:hypothetical protein B0H10DRAFT_2113525 [Mycena sp. CBHHK59/15]|nr:hypothetical protein B0H10DRAFT_2113525 [Mycena sp. CBHHK59/15]
MPMSQAREARVAVKCSTNSFLPEIRISRHGVSVSSCHFRMRCQLAGQVSQNIPFAFPRPALSPFSSRHLQLRCQQHSPRYAPLLRSA